PAEARGDAAIRIERDRRAEVRLGAARQQLRAHGPEQRAGAMGPSDQADAVARHPSLLHQPSPRRRDILDPLAACAHLALLDPALRAETARTEAVRQQHRLAVLQKLL